jgi:hypothetical protein
MESEKLNEIKKDMKEKQIAVIKKAVKMTFEKLDTLENQKNEIQNQIKICKHDLFDLKDGRLDRILERQVLNGEAKSISVITINKIPTNGASSTVSPWYEDYEFKVLNDNSCRVNNSITKTHASGSYKLDDGTIKYL